MAEAIAVSAIIIAITLSLWVAYRLGKHGGEITLDGTIAVIAIIVAIAIAAFTSIERSEPESHASLGTDISEVTSTSVVVPTVLLGTPDATVTPDTTVISNVTASAPMQAINTVITENWEDIIEIPADMVVDLPTGIRDEVSSVIVEGGCAFFYGSNESSDEQLTVCESISELEAKWEDHVKEIEGDCSTNNIRAVVYRDSGYQGQSQEYLLCRSTESEAPWRMLLTGWRDAEVREWRADEVVEAVGPFWFKVRSNGANFCGVVAPGATLNSIEEFSVPLEEYWPIETREKLIEYLTLADGLNNDSFDVEDFCLDLLDYTFVIVLETDTGQVQVTESQLPLPAP